MTKKQHRHKWSDYLWISATIHSQRVYWQRCDCGAARLTIAAPAGASIRTWVIPAPKKLKL